MHKVLSWKITGLFQNFRYFPKFTIAVRTSTIVNIPVRYLSLRTLTGIDRISEQCTYLSTGIDRIPEQYIRI